MISPPRTTMLQAAILLLAGACAAGREAPDPAPGSAQAGGASPVQPAPPDAAQGVSDGGAPLEDRPEEGARESGEEPYRTAATATGLFTVHWRPAGRGVPLNEYFELDVRLERGEASGPLEGAKLFVSAWMPDHGHGLVVSPRAEDLGEGLYRVRGMLLHMGGFWQLFFDVVDGDGISERAAFELELE